MIAGTWKPEDACRASTPASPGPKQLITPLLSAITTLFLKAQVNCHVPGKCPLAPSPQTGLAGPSLCSLNILCSRFCPSRPVPSGSVTTPGTHPMCCDSRDERGMGLVRAWHSCFRMSASQVEGLELELADAPGGRKVSVGSSLLA